MRIKVLVKVIEDATGQKVDSWELAKIYTAFNADSEVLAQYDTRTGKLNIVK